MRQLASSRNGRPAARRTADVWVLVFPGFLLLDAAGPAQVFSTANDGARDEALPPPYRIHLLSVAGGAVISSSGIAVMTQPLPRPSSLHGATLVVSGGRDIDRVIADKSVLHWIVRAHKAVSRCCAVCNAALLFAGAGLLRNRRAVTHWMDVEHLKRSYPEVQVHDDAIYIRDGRIYTSAGITAGIDLCLGLVEEDLGRTRALNVAKRLVVYHKRPGGQRQFSSELLAQSSPGDLAQRLMQWLRPRIHLQIDIEQMAAAVAMSSRSLHRRLRQELDLSPAQLLRRLRIETACRLLEDGKDSITQVARRSGFGSEYNLRRAFASNMGLPPREYRARFG